MSAPESLFSFLRRRGLTVIWYGFWPPWKWRFYVHCPSPHGPWNGVLLGFVEFLWPTR